MKVAVIVVIVVALLLAATVWADVCACRNGRCVSNPAVTCQTSGECGSLFALR